MSSELKKNTMTCKKDQETIIAKIPTRRQSTASVRDKGSAVNHILKTDFTRKML